MDSIGIDENNCPVIFEYKRSSSENIINQGLFYLDWLLDHKADFQLLVMNTLGKEAAKEIDWSAPCVFCIAKEFTKFDEHAVNQMQRNIKLIKYNKYGENLILFEHINVPVLKKILFLKERKQNRKRNYQRKTIMIGKVGFRNYRKKNRNFIFLSEIIFFPKEMIFLKIH